MNRGVGGFADDTNPAIWEGSEWAYYSGANSMGLSTIEFAATPGLKGAILYAVETANWVGVDLLRIEVRQDTEPFFDQYQVQIWTKQLVGVNSGTIDPLSVSGVSSTGAGVGAVPFAVLVAVGAIALLAVVVGVIYWYTRDTILGKLLFSPLGMGLVAAGILYFVFFRSRG